jgi:hypothetical protein
MHIAIPNQNIEKISMCVKKASENFLFKTLITFLFTDFIVGDIEPMI